LLAGGISGNDGYELSGRKHLSVSGCDLVETAETFGTPFIMLDESYMRQRCRVFVRALADSRLLGTTYYAAENLPAQAVLRIVRQEGLGGSASSLLHAHAFIMAGYRPENIIIHAAGMAENEMRELIKLGAFTIVLDNADGVAPLAEAAAELDARVRVMLRINPCVTGIGRARESLWGASPGGRFGLTVDDGEAMRAVKLISSYSNLHLAGFHCSVGTQVDSYDPFRLMLEKMTDLAVLAMFVTGVEIEEFNIGGGFKIKYAIDDIPSDITPTFFRIRSDLQMMCERKGMGVPRVSCEPGREIVQEAGTLVTRVMSVKHQEGFRPYAVLDVRAPRTFDPVMSQKQPEFALANRPREDNDEIYVLADRSLEPDGILCWNAFLPSVREGDLITQFAAGVLPWSERGIGAPMILIAQYGHAQVISERPTEKFFMALDKVPSRLNR
jgi:diaminopimelate decarboxylase